MKKAIAGFIAGVMAASTISVYAASVSATANTFNVTVNGNEAKIAGYNIEGSTYFKLRDIADAVGGFSVGFENNTITIETTAPAAPGERPAMDARAGGASAADLKARLEQEVAEGKITQAQADEMIKQIESGNIQRGNPPQGALPQN